METRSKTKVSMPWTLKIWSEKLYATCEGAKVDGNAWKRSYMSIQSTTTIMIILFATLGIPTMKFIEMSIHIWLGMGSGCKAHGDLIVFFNVIENFHRME